MVTTASPATYVGQDDLSGITSWSRGEHVAVELRSEDGETVGWIGTNGKSFLARVLFDGTWTGTTHTTYAIAYGWAIAALSADFDGCLYWASQCAAERRFKAAHWWLNRAESLVQ